LFTIWVTFHVLICIALVIVVLLQSAKGEGLAGSAFGGGGGVGSAVFGGRGAAGFLSKATTVLAIVFMVNCGALAFMSAGSRVGAEFGEGGESVVQRRAQQELDQQRQMQQQQQQADSAVGADSAGIISIEDYMNQPEPAPDTAGGGN
jgi:preprotein translocase subunit SecG